MRQYIVRGDLAQLIARECYEGDKISKLTMQAFAETVGKTMGWLDFTEDVAERYMDILATAAE